MPMNKGQKYLFLALFAAFISIISEERHFSSHIVRSYCPNFTTLIVASHPENVLISRLLGNGMRTCIAKCHTEMLSILLHMFFPSMWILLFLYVFILLQLLSFVLIFSCAVLFCTANTYNTYQHGPGILLLQNINFFIALSEMGQFSRFGRAIMVISF